MLNFFFSSADSLPCALILIWRLIWVRNHHVNSSKKHACLIFIHRWGSTSDSRTQGSHLRRTDFRRTARKTAAIIYRFFFFSFQEARKARLPGREGGRWGGEEGGGKRLPGNGHRHEHWPGRLLLRQPQPSLLLLWLPRYVCVHARTCVWVCVGGGGGGG